VDVTAISTFFVTVIVHGLSELHQPWNQRSSKDRSSPFRKPSKACKLVNTMRFVWRNAIGVPTIQHLSQRALIQHRRPLACTSWCVNFCVSLSLRLLLQVFPTSLHLPRSRLRTSVPSQDHTAPFNPPNAARSSFPADRGQSFLLSHESLLRSVASFTFLILLILPSPLFPLFIPSNLPLSEGQKEEQLEGNHSSHPPIDSLYAGFENCPDLK
jgi:hypothetical protein